MSPLKLKMMFAGIPAPPKRRKAFTAGFVVQAIGLTVLISLGLIRPAAILGKEFFSS